MLMIFILLSLYARFPYIISTFIGDCVPNTQFILNGRVCRCDNSGQWSEDNCKLNLIADSRALCSPGTILWQGCNYCVCRESGHLSCAENACSATGTDEIHQSLNKVIEWCTPFRSYYVNCRICVCPASGRTSDARCATDASCSNKEQPTSFDISTKITTCIPKVMYLFSCLHCMCSDEGVFAPDKCVETCPVKHKSESMKICIPGSFYRNNRNVCKCPSDGISDDRLCTKSSSIKLNLKNLKSLQSDINKCTAYTFSTPRCLYCECSAQGTLDESACFEHECFKTDKRHDDNINTCNSGGIVHLCVECLCMRHGNTLEEYCSRTCSYNGKLKVLRKIVRDSRKNDQLLDTSMLKKNPAKDMCQPNSLYIDRGRYCICPDNGNTHFNLCTTTPDDIDVPTVKTHAKGIIDFNVSCEPNTYVDFDCNSCFCSKNGTIDPKWCTYDDCEVKKIIQEAHAAYTLPLNHKEDLTSLECTPGSLYRVQCNFCICPSNGRTEDRVCTKNVCEETDYVNSANLICEPLAYYEVDCNVCFCPRDGIKNVGRCTKNHCEKSYLRSDSCVAGQLFSDECNVCVCPPNGSQEDKACTNYTCTDTAPWQKIFQLSESLIQSTNNEMGEDTTRQLDLCFPGEEYIVGCKLCVCPDMGLRIYAHCAPMGCDDGDEGDKTRIQEEESSLQFISSDRDTMSTVASDRVVRSASAVPLRRAEKCMTFNTTQSPPPYRTQCTPGSMYILRCKQCVCPYMGSINPFCRPLPKDFYCEQAYPGVNYVAMGRRDDESLSEPKTQSSSLTLRSSPSATSKMSIFLDNTSLSTSEPSSNVTVFFLDDQSYFSDNMTLFNGTKGPITHLHTIYACEKIGRLMDRCYICECEEPGQFVEEHCFKSEQEECFDMKPSFLDTLVN